MFVLIQESFNKFVVFLKIKIKDANQRSLRKTKTYIGCALIMWSKFLQTYHIFSIFRWPHWSFSVIELIKNDNTRKLLFINTFFFSTEPNGNISIAKSVKQHQCYILWKLFSNKISTILNHQKHTSAISLFCMMYCLVMNPINITWVNRKQNTYSSSCTKT